MIGPNLAAATLTKINGVPVAVRVENGVLTATLPDWYAAATNEAMREFVVSLFSLPPASPRP